VAARERIEKPSSILSLRAHQERCIAADLAPFAVAGAILRLPEILARAPNNGSKLTGAVHPSSTKGDDT